MKLPEKPEHVHQALATAWNTGNVDNVLALYENNGVLVPELGRTVSGKAKIKEALLGFLEVKGTFEIKTMYCVTYNDIAISRSLWSIRVHPDQSHSKRTLIQDVTPIRVTRRGL